MKTRHLLSFRQAVSVGSIITILTLGSFNLEPVSGARPFWTKSSSYIEGEFVYLVGTVSNMASLAEAKQQALVHGKLELMNFAKISEIDAEKLLLETRHSYVEKNSDGSVNVFQLLRIPASTVLEAQTRLQAKRKAQAVELEASHKQLSTIHNVLLTRQQTIDEQTASLDTLIGHISKKQQGYAQKTQEIDQRQTEIRQLELTLEEKFASIDDQMKQVSHLLQQYKTKGEAQTIQLNNLKDEEAKLQENEEEIQRIQQAVLARLKKTGTMACQYVSPGMAPADVKKVLGNPSGEKHSYANERYDTWAYGTSKVNFDAQGVVESVTGCQNATP
ncbi:MAG: hypothetical protein NPIRA04_15080 [Nitrospirales bacterium]|nr:MAG: hypothetical protein NPIRA04_15080 [Nitrospirales bacterium]